MSTIWQPLYPIIEQSIRDHQPERFRWPRPSPDGWIGPLHSPLRDDREASFSLLPDSPTDPGAWTDHATGETGSIADLARRLGVDPRQSKSDPKPEGEGSLEAFSRRRKLDRQQLEQHWNVREAVEDGRPALRFPTRLRVDRLKFLDGGKPKARWAASGGEAHWYALPASQRIGGPLLYIVNGEPSVWACHQSGVAATCTMAGEGTAPTPAMIDELAKSGFERFRIVFDRDDHGRAGALALVRLLKDAGLDAEALELPPDLGVGGDVDDLHRVVGDEALADRLTALPDLCVVASTEDWRELQPIPESTDPVPGLPVELLPVPLRPWLEDLAGRAVLPVELPSVPAIIALGSVVGRSLAIRPELRDDWTVVPNLWGGIVARPGLLKTHAIESGLAPLSPLIKEAEEEFIEEARTVAARRMVLEDRLKAARRQKGGATESAIASLLAEIEECHAVERRLKTHDATVEKLGELLRDNPGGLLLVRDELAGWFRTFDRHGREGEREFFLEAWNGTGGYTFDRIERGTIRIPALCLSVVGGIQPGKLAAYVAGAVGGGQGADGLLQRLQVVAWPDRLEEWTEPSRWPDHEAKARAFQIYASLYNLEPSTVGAMADDGLPFLKFAPDAQELFTAWRNELERRLRGDELLAFPAFESHLAKYRSLMPSLALLFHLVDVVAGAADAQAGVSLNAARQAAAWCEFLELHARKIYSVELAPERSAARAIADRIKAGAVEHGSTVRDLYRSQWADLRTPEVVGDGLDLLERLGWLRVIRDDRSGPGRRSNRLELHPDLRKRS